MSALSTAASGLDAAIEQLTVAASNLVNSQTAGVEAAESLTLGSSALGASADSAASAPSPTGSTVSPPLAYRPLQLVQYSNADMAGGGVSTVVQPTSSAAYAAYGPSSAYAEADGEVASTAIDLPTELVNEASALIQFQANLKVAEASEQMQESVIDRSA